MFGFSFGELLIVLLVALIVIGPKDLPKMLRKLGQYAGKLRRYATEMRVNSGIDEALRSEGLDKDIAEIRRLTRGELDGVVSATREATRIDDRPYGATATFGVDDPNAVIVDREREMPREGADSYGALPDTAIVYAETLPASAHATDPVYIAGIPMPAEPAHDDPVEDAPIPASLGANEAPANDDDRAKQEPA